MEISNNLGEFVKKRRQAMGMSLREFGKLCKMSHTHIDSIEKGYDVRSGRKVNLTGSSINKLANALGVSETEIMNMYMGQSEERRAFTDEDLKFALFGDGEISDAMLDEVKKFAGFIKARNGGSV